MSSLEKVTQWRPSAAQKLSDDLLELQDAALAGGMSTERFDEIRKSIWYRVRLPVDYATHGYQRRSKAAEAKNRRKKQAINRATAKTATNSRQRWTAKDDEMVLDAVLSDEEIARLVGRTLMAVQSRRNWLTANPRNRRRDGRIPSSRLPLGRVPAAVSFDGRQLTRRQIMIELGIPATTVKRRIRRLLGQGVTELHRADFSDLLHEA